ncbi:MAG: DAK2 domain-containing protein [Peptococcaceae bacterium]|nr:DAK2 domain-containing protein [Peptococcaceae bacterium]
MSLEPTIQTISAEQFFNMVLAGADNLDLHKESVNQLNVFPVPDGDTGTNMAMTMQSAAKFIRQVEKPDMEEYAKQAAFGAVMGARGNSGVIFSQILTGIAKGVAGHECIDAATLVQGFNSGVQSAYKAVSNPMEGTILTVVREASEALSAKYKKNMDILECLRIYIAAGHASLERTPELLPVLKQAGVVDAGGAGYLYVVEGMLASLEGKTIEKREIVKAEKDDLNEQFDHFFGSPEEIIYPYCTEFLVRTKKPDVEEDIDTLKGMLSDLGDCMLVVGAGSTIKVHIHTDRLARVIECGASFGELDDIKINNMRSQNRALQDKGKNVTPSPVVFKDAIIVVCNGEGLADIFNGLGATHIISGGQTMNPSTQDFLDVIAQIEAENIYILPNNKNIIMTANQAASMAEKDNVHVVASKSFPQGISALMGYMPDATVEDNINNMVAGLSAVQSGEITQAVRDTNIDGVAIHEQEYMSIIDGKIVASCSTLAEAVHAMVQTMVDDDAELISLHYGLDVDADDAEALLEQLEEQYDDIDFELYDGGQNVYHYIVSAE